MTCSSLLFTLRKRFFTQTHWTDNKIRQFFIWTVMRSNEEKNGQSSVKQSNKVSRIQRRKYGNEARKSLKNKVRWLGCIGERAYTQERACLFNKKKRFAVTIVHSLPAWIRVLPYTHRPLSHFHGARELFYSCLGWCIDSLELLRSNQTQMYVSISIDVLLLLLLLFFFKVWLQSNVDIRQTRHTYKNWKEKKNEKKTARSINGRETELKKNTQRWRWKRSRRNTKL